MDCLIHLLALCVFDPSNVYVTAGLEKTIHDGDSIQIAQRCYDTAYCVKDQPGPHGILKLGVSIEFTRSLVFDYGVGHHSYVNYSKDHGQQFAFAELTWRPFK